MATSTYPSYVKTPDQREAVDRLRELLPPGTTVRTILRHTSRSGMSRRISAVWIDGEVVYDLDRLIHNTGLFRESRDHLGLVVGGAGMDMGFHLVYSLSRMLYPDGVPCTGSSGYTPTGKPSKLPRCHSNDHFNGDRVYRKGKTHRDGGYALSQSWL